MPTTSSIVHASRPLGYFRPLLVAVVWNLGACVTDSPVAVKATDTEIHPLDSSSTSANSVNDDDTDGDETSTSTGVVQTCTAPQPAERRNISFATGSGALHGTWMAPEGCPPFSTVLFHVGSGPTDRDGNTPVLPGRNDGHLQLAEALQSAGIASLRFDKRGIAASAGALEDVGTLVLDTYVDDLVGWTELLRSDSNLVGPLLLLGHSEGGLIATLAAGRSEIDGLVLVASPGRPFADVLRDQLETNLAHDPDLLATALEILAALERGETVDAVPTELLALFSPEIQGYLISSLARDPADELASLSTPTLILGGTDDIQVPSTEAEVLADARPDAELVIVQGMTHTMKDAAMGQDAAYNDPDVPLATGLVGAIETFVLAQ